MLDLSTFAKMIIFTGVLITTMGILFLFADKLPWFGKLPGDIYIERENFSIYLPITTCIIASIVISLILYLLARR